METYKAKRKYIKGIATLEILIAITLLMLVLSSVIMLVFGSQTSEVSSETHQEALYKAQELLENARANARANFSSVVSTPPVNDNIYVKNITVTDINSLTKQVTSQVSWNGLTTILSTIVSDWQGALGICNPVLSGDWTNPQVYGYVDFPSANGASAVDIKTAKAYVTSDPHSAGADDFYVIDVNDPTLKPLPILGHFSTTYGLTFVSTQGGYSYVSADSAAYQLLIIDSSNPAALDTTKIKGKLDVTAPGDTAYGNTLFYANNKIYLGLTLSTGPEFHIIDVSNPSAPVEVGPGYEVGAAINRITVKNNIAYLATAANNEVIALDVSNPASINFLGAYTSTALTGQSLFLDNGTTLYFGRIGGNGNPKLLALDTGNLSSPKWTFDMSKQSGVYTMILRSNLLFMTTADPNDGLQIWDVSNPSGPPVRYDTSPLNIQQGATAGSDCAGNLLYVAQRSNRAMQIVGPYVPTPFDYTFSTPPTDVTLTSGGSSKNVDFTITRISGTSQPVNFTNSSIPSGVTMNYSGTSCSPACTTTLTLSATSAAALGTTTMTIFGNSPLHTTTFNIIVNALFDYSLSNTGNATTTQGGTDTVTINNALISGTTKPITLSVSGISPSDHITVTWTNNPCSSTCSSTLMLKTSGSSPKTPKGSYPITVTGSPNGAGVRTTSFTLVVN
jgi:Tfp pilus assembly protein PilV